MTLETIQIPAQANPSQCRETGHRFKAFKPIQGKSKQKLFQFAAKIQKSFTRIPANQNPPP
jgi:hypothetical protein